MILSLSISNVVFIDKLEIDFQNGLVVFTGETGAGKSIILESISLALGSKSNPSLVKNDCESSIIILIIKKNSLIEQICKDLFISTDDEIHIKRVQFKDGRTKSYINDNLVSLSIIKSISSKIVELHGQNDDTSFIDQSKHIDIIDSVGNYKSELITINRLSLEMNKLRIDIEERYKKLSDTSNQKSHLEEICNEIEALSLEKDEEHMLLEKRKLAMGKSKVVESLANIKSIINQDNGVQDLSRKIYGEVTNLMSTKNEMIDELNEDITQIDNRLTNVMSIIERIQQEIDIQGNDIDFIEQRLFSIKALARKYNVLSEDLQGYYLQIKKELNLLNSDLSEVTKIEDQYADLLKEYKIISNQLSEKRRIISKEFDISVLQELKDLKFPNINFKTSIERKISENYFGKKGEDIVSIEISTNRTSPLDLITNVASGGELSRIILAIKSVMSKRHQVKTLIFDEIDSGVSGSTATAIGKKLSLIAKELQIFSVTHSPQVAARANHHYLIQKTEYQNNTESVIIISELDKTQRVEEIARMLSGEKITNQAREASKSLLYDDV
jgi:DNA repair protein RecN (Recombination protein N)